MHVGALCLRQYQLPPCLEQAKHTGEKYPNRDIFHVKKQPATHVSCGRQKLVVALLRGCAVIVQKELMV